MDGELVIMVLLTCLGIFSANAATVTVSPNVKATKGDTSVKCPNGFVRYEESCYSFHSEAFSWPEALVFCQTFKNTLVTLRSTAQYEFLQGILATITGGFTAAGFWTAGTAADLPGEWKWATNNEDIEFDTFNATDPNKATMGFMTQQRSGCLVLAKALGFRISRMDCKTPLHFVCERLDPF